MVAYPDTNTIPSLLENEDDLDVYITYPDAKPLSSLFADKDDDIFGGFTTSMREKSLGDPLTKYALTFFGPGGIYRYADALGFVPNHQQLELMVAYDEAVNHGGSPRIACRAGKGPGKCPTGDMLIYDKKLGHIRVDQVEGKDLEILSMSKDLKLEYKKAICKKSTVQECTKIITDSGNELKISSNHKVFTQRGWVEARYVNTKDLMAVPRNFDISTKGDISIDDCSLLGYLVGDGGTSQKSSVKFSQQDNITLACVKRLVKAKGGYVRYIGKYDYYLGKMQGFAREHGLEGVLSKHKQIPEKVWSAKPAGLAAFLKALWECDGYVTKDGYGICLASKRLMMDIQIALASFGMYTSIRYKKCKCGDKYFDAWRLEVSGSDNLNTWMRVLGTVPGKPLRGRVLTKKPNSNKDIVPIKDVEWNGICKELGVSNNYLRTFSYRGVKHACMGRSKFEKFVKQFNYEGKYSKLAYSDIRWVKVEACENIGDIQTYDVSVEDNHNFVCNNLIVHNTKITAVIFTHWSMVHPDSQLIVTAPTFRQCKNVWLAEAKSTIYSSIADPRIGMVFNFTGKGYGILGAKPEDWGCQLITAVTKEAFQGLHNLYIAFLEEEASGVKADISNAIKETLSNSKGTWLHVRIGNPNTRVCAFFDSFHKEKSKWNCLHWNTEETEETIYFSRRRNEEIAEEFGKNSDIYRISVLGEFPNIDPNCLIAEEDLDICCTSLARTNATYINPDHKKQIGMDLARYGGDECVDVARDGGLMLDIWAEKTDPNNAIDKAIFMQDMLSWGNKDMTFVVDTSGMGEVAVGAIGDARRMGRQVHEFYSQNTAHNSDKYHDKISEAWCEFAKLVRKAWVYLGERLDKKLRDQLTTRRYIVTPKGKIKIESKDEYAKNNADTENGTIGKSPDRADGVVMAFYDHASTSLRIASGG